MRSIYIETTIPSFVVAKNSRDIIILGQQETTRLFWDTEADKFNLYISQAVYDECKKGDIITAQKRLDLIKPLKYP